MKFSVITTVLEADEKLDRTIKSVRSRYEFEHVITVARNFPKAEKMAKDLGWRCRLVSTPGLRIAPGFNEAIRACSTGIVICLNAGDEAVDFDALIEVLLANPDVDMAYGDHYTMGQVIRARPTPITKATLRWYGMCFSHCAVAYRKKLHEKFGIYSSNFEIAMDFSFLAKAIVGGARLDYVQKPVALIEAAGISGSVIRRNVEGMRALLSFTPKPLAFAIFCKLVLFQTAGATLRRLHLRGERIAEPQTSRTP